MVCTIYSDYYREFILIVTIRLVIITQSLVVDSSPLAILMQVGLPILYIFYKQRAVPGHAGNRTGRVKLKRLMYTWAGPKKRLVFSSIRHTRNKFNRFRKRKMKSEPIYLPDGKVWLQYAGTHRNPIPS